MQVPKVIQIFLLSFFIIYSGDIDAQQSSQWYKKYDQGNRYEGYYMEEISGGLIDIISFYGQVPTYLFGQGEQLEVNYYAPKPDPRYLKAEELQILAYYWMEAKPENAKKGWNRFSNWPVDNELRQADVKAQNLAILLRLGGVRSRTLAPVWVNSRPDSKQEINYFAYFRTGVGIKRAQFEVYKGNFKDKLIPENGATYQGFVGRKSGGSYFPIMIPASALNKEGWVTVKISFEARRVADHIPDFEFYFYHKSD